MELYRKVRLACADGMSKRAAARHFNISRDSVDKILVFSTPPGAKPRAQVRQNRLIQSSPYWPWRAKAASQPPAIWRALLPGRPLVARVTPKSKVTDFCAAQ